MSESRQEEEKVHISPAETSLSTRVVAMLIGGVVFVVVVPGVLYLAGGAVYQSFLYRWLGSLKFALSVGSILLGLLLAAWSAMMHLTAGKGTPVPFVPSQKLIVTGPYRFCRNPIQLGAMIYYFGLGAFLGSFKIGLLMFVIALIVGSCYHKFYEEKELFSRYGREYEEYRQKTPFLIPKLWG